MPQPSLKDKALRQTATFLIRLAAMLEDKAEHSVLHEAMKHHADLCCLALPNRLRYSKEELAELRRPPEPAA